METGPHHAPGDGEIRVDPPAVRRTAAELADAAYRVTNTLRGSPGLTVTAPGWAAATALSSLEDVMAGWLRQLGVDTAAAAGLMRQAMDAYEETDAAAARLTAAAVSPAGTDPRPGGDRSW